MPSQPPALPLNSFSLFPFSLLHLKQNSGAVSSWLDIQNLSQMGQTTILVFPGLQSLLSYAGQFTLNLPPSFTPFCLAGFFASPRRIFLSHIFLFLIMDSCFQLRQCLGCGDGMGRDVRGRICYNSFEQQIHQELSLQTFMNV